MRKKSNWLHLFSSKVEDMPFNTLLRMFGAKIIYTSTNVVNIRQ